MKKVPGTSKRIAEIRPETEWMLEEHPELEIIEDNLRNRVQIRLKGVRKKTSSANKRARGHPQKYLLSGLMKCGVCGANHIMHDICS